MAEEGKIEQKKEEKVETREEKKYDMIKKFAYFTKVLEVYTLLVYRVHCILKINLCFPSLYLKNY